MVIRSFKVEKPVFKQIKNFNVELKERFVSSGHLACQGCGIMPAYNLALQVYGKETIVACPACCFAVVDGPFPSSATRVPLTHCAFEATAAVASGIRAGLDVLGKKNVNVIGWAGDGGTFDIGIQALSAAAERNENILYVCYDNEAYMNTGIQRSSATPLFSWTTTTPVSAPKQEPKKDIVAILAAHKIPYIATATIAFPDDLVQKFETAKNIKGFKFIHYFCVCPTGWKSEAKYAIKLSRLAVETKVFPLIEIFNGETYKINYIPKGLPVNEYFKLQGRFAHLKEEDIKLIQQEIEKNWNKLLKKASNNNN